GPSTESHVVVSKLRKAENSFPMLTRLTPFRRSVSWQAHHLTVVLRHPTAISPSRLCNSRTYRQCSNLPIFQFTGCHGRAVGHSHHWNCGIRSHKAVGPAVFLE